MVNNGQKPQKVINTTRDENAQTYYLLGACTLIVLALIASVLTTTARLESSQTFKPADAGCTAFNSLTLTTDRFIILISDCKNNLTPLLYTKAEAIFYVWMVSWFPWLGAWILPAVKFFVSIYCACVCDSTKTIRYIIDASLIPGSYVVALGLTYGMPIFGMTTVFSFLVFLVELYTLTVHGTMEMLLGKPTKEG